MTWDSATYLRFAGERTRAAADLVQRIPLDAPKGIVDLGCGPGNSTALLAARWPEATIIGLDSSPEMIHAARESAVPARFDVADAAAWAPDHTVDLVYSNAMFHWLDRQEDVIARIFAGLAPGACLAFQVPGNHDAPSHRIVREIAAHDPWADKFKPALARNGVSAPASYLRRLRPLARAVDVWETTYLQVLDGEEPVYRWLRGTTLTPFFGVLPPDLEARFDAALRDAFAGAYPKEPDGRTLFPFRRIFCVAVRA